jgi:hypothetical protein
VDRGKKPSTASVAMEPQAEETATACWDRVRLTSRHRR